MLTSPKLGRPTAKLPGKHAGEVMSIGEAVFDRDLINRFIR
jgi:hypothetical protein